MHGLKPVTLELGGKSPQIVYADADLTKAASYISNSFCSHAGQVCFAGTRLIVQAGAANELIERVSRAMDNLRPGPTWREESTFGPIANHSQANRLEQLLAESIAAGAEVLSGGKRIETGSNGIFFEPTLLGQLANENPAVTQELFGPVLTIQTFDTEEEALTLAEHPVYGLASGVYTSDIAKAMRAARVIQAGTVWINHYGPVADINAPMGGYKQSGFGKDFGVAGLMKYLKSKNVSVRF
jgi:aldehyde dehydrogenase (NAD+)